MKLKSGQSPGEGWCPKYETAPSTSVQSAVKPTKTLVRVEVSIEVAKLGGGISDSGLSSSWNLQPRTGSPRTLQRQQAM